MNLTDQELIEGIREGNLPSLEGLFRRWAKPVYSFFQVLTSDRYRSEDTTQEVFRILWNTRDTIARDAIPRVEIFRVAVSIMRKISTGPKESVDDIDIDWTAAFWNEPGQGEPAGKGEWDRTIRSALGNLPQERRIRLALARWSELSLDEVAASVGATLGETREDLLLALDAVSAATGPSRSRGTPACAESPPGFPLPGETVSPGDHFESCGSCRSRIDFHRDAWEALAGMSIPGMREGVWPELKISLASLMKVRTARPTGRLPRPDLAPAPSRAVSTKFWTRLTAALSIAIALLFLYMILFPGEKPEPRGGQPSGTGEKTVPGAVKRPVEVKRTPLPAPPPFRLSWNPEGLRISSALLEFEGAGLFEVFLWRAESPKAALAAYPDPRHPSSGFLPEISPAFTLVEISAITLLSPGDGRLGRRTLSVAAKSAGLHVLQVRRGDFVCSAVGGAGGPDVTARRAPGNAAVAVSRSGKPCASALVEAFVDGRPAWRGSADGAGFALFDCPPGGVLTVAAEGSALAVCGPPAPDPGAKPVVVVGADARPDAGFGFFGLSPDTEGQSPVPKVFLDGREIAASIEPGSGSSGLFALRAGRPPWDQPGKASLAVEFAPGFKFAGEIDNDSPGDRADLFAAPFFDTSTGAAVPAFRLEAFDSFQGAGHAAAFAGVSWRMTSNLGGRVLEHEGRTILDESGRAVVFAYQFQPPCTVLFEAAKQGGRLMPLAEGRFGAGFANCEIEAMSDFAVAGKPFELTVRASTPSGAPAGGLAVSLDAGEGGPQLGLETNALGEARASLVFMKAGTAVVRATIAREGKKISSASITIPVWDGTAVASPAVSISENLLSGGGLSLLVRGGASIPLVTLQDSRGKLRIAGGSAGLFEIGPAELESAAVRVDCAAATGPGAGNGLFSAMAGSSVTARLLSARHEEAGGNGGSLRAWKRQAGAPENPEAADRQAQLLVLAPLSGRLPELPDFAPPGPPSSAAFSGGLVSSGAAVTGWYSFQPAGKTSDAVRGLTEKLAATGAQGAETDRFHALDPAQAAAELKERLTRAAPLRSFTAEAAGEAAKQYPAAAMLVSTSPPMRAAFGFGQASLPAEFHGPSMTMPGAIVCRSGFGLARRTVTLRRSSPLRLSLSVPRLAPEDEAFGLVTVANDGATGFTGRIEAVAGAEGTVGAELPGFEVAVKAGGRSETWIPIPAIDGPASLTVMLDCGGGARLTSTKDLSRRPKPPKWAWALSGTASGPDPARVEIPAGFDQASQTLTLRAGFAPLHAVQACLDDSPDLPLPGCLEKAGRVQGICAGLAASEVRPRAGELSSEQKLDLYSAIYELGRYRARSGGYSLAEGGAEDPFATAAVCFGMAYARQLAPPPDYPGPPRELVDRVRRLAGPASDADEEPRAYLLLALAAAGDAETVKRTAAERFGAAFRKSMPPATLARLCMALKIAGSEEAFAAVAGDLRACFKADGGALKVLKLRPPGLEGSDPVEAAALALAALEPFPKGDPFENALVDFVIGARHGTGWGGAFRNAQAMLGLAAAARFNPPAGAKPGARINSIFEAAFDHGAAGAKAVIAPGEFSAGVNSLEFETQGKRIFWSISGEGPASGLTRGRIGLAVSFRPMTNVRGTWSAGEPSTVFKAGDAVCVETAVTVGEDADEIEIDVPLPGGFVRLPADRFGPVERSRAVGEAGLFARHLPEGVHVFRSYALAAWKGRYASSSGVARSLASGEFGYSEPVTIKID